MPTKRTPEEEWYQMLTQGENVPHHFRHLMGLLPSSPRCKMCNSPLASACEILISEAAYTAAGIDLENPERQGLELKGKN